MRGDDLLNLSRKGAKCVKIIDDEYNANNHAYNGLPFDGVTDSNFS